MNRVKLFSLFACAFAASSAHANPVLVPSVPSGATVGTTVTWTDSTSGEPDPTQLKTWRFTVSSPNGEDRILRDYDFGPLFTWTPLEEGVHQVTVIKHVIDLETFASTFTNSTKSFEVLSLINTGSSKPKVSETSHPLVALYSVPPCSSGEKVRVEFRTKCGLTGASWAPWATTLSKDCGDGMTSVNFFVAGMKSKTTYQMRHVETSAATSGKTIFVTGSLEINAPEFEVTQGADNLDTCSAANTDLILQATLFGQAVFIPENGQFPNGCPLATDLSGNIVWYYKEAHDYYGSLMMSFPDIYHENDKYWMMMARPLNASQIPRQVLSAAPTQILREIDFAGNTVRETNVERINEQLRNLNFRSIYHFHHDVWYHPDGLRIIVMGGAENLLVNPQGKTGTGDVICDTVTVLDENMQVKWHWDGCDDHDKLPIKRRAFRSEECDPFICGPIRKMSQTTCEGGNSSNSCVHDWTHGNTVTYTPQDKNLILSFRHQDWICKIDFRDGEGDGQILWCLGDRGDFHLTGDDPDQWFSGQHQPMIYGDNEIVIFDNANALNENRPQESAAEVKNSRGQVYQINETDRTATLVLNADLGGFSPFLGSSQKLSNGNYHFLSGGIADVEPSFPGLPVAGSTESSEVDPDGTIKYTLRSNGTVTYRSFRMKSLYEVNNFKSD